MKISVVISCMRFWINSHSYCCNFFQKPMKSPAKNVWKNFFAKVANSYKLLTISAKNSIIDVCWVLSTPLFSIFSIISFHCFCYLLLLSLVSLSLLYLALSYVLSFFYQSYEASTTSLCLMSGYVSYFLSKTN